MARCPVLVVLLLSACDRPGGAARQPTPPPPETRPVGSRDAGAGRPRAIARPATPPPPVIGVEAAADILFGADPKPRQGPTPVTTALGACPEGTRAARIRCLIARRYRADPRAALLARQIYDRFGSVVGLEPRQRTRMGWRGLLTLVPELPVRRYRRHLRWLAAALDDFGRLFTGLKQGLRGRDRRIRYRWTALAYKYFRSVGRRTPSAYAWAWSVAINVSGSLLGRPAGVRETLFHEVFHLNDRDHGQFSEKRLKPLYDAIVKRCTRRQGGRSGLSNRCLKPYAPHRTRVMGGVYYAFHPESGVGEYGAELAVRYYLEHRAALGRGKRPRPFKCRTPENARAWRLLAGEFFGGVDLTGACP